MNRLLLILLLAGVLACGAFAQNGSMPLPRRQSLDFGWRFTTGDLSGAERPEFADGAWQAVDVPHDWSIAGTWSATNPSGGAGGFSPLGIGWYRKRFVIPASAAGKRLTAEFEGVFNHADVWLNGVKVGHNDNGYMGFPCDLTAAARPGGENTLVVRADNAKQASRWYTGSGIYRHVWLTVTNPLHVAYDGTYVTTPMVGERAAQVSVRTALRNDSTAPKQATLVTTLLDPNGRPAGTESAPVEIPAGEEKTVAQQIRLAEPLLWSPDAPRLYRAVSELREGERAADRYETPFGIRSARFDVKSGFTLNGKRVVLKGVCLHHELGALGAAALEPAIERRLRLLKEMDCNAVRLSHNPYSPELLDLCDRLGLIVFAEAFDKWHGFQPDGTGWKDDLHRFVQRDRNHPSIVIWSVGNEMTPHMYRHEGAVLFQSMAGFLHQYEPTRPVTAALHPVRTARGERDAPLAEIAQYMDVISMNYQTRWYPRDHQQHPDQVLLGSEVHLHQRNLGAPTDPKDGSGNQWFGTRDYATNEYYPYVAGQFIWAGFDYLGEAREWPSKGYRDALLNTCGFRKPFSWYHQSLYTDRPLVHIGVENPDYRRNPRRYGSGNWAALVSHWNLPAEQKTARVYTFTNAPAVRLLLNGKALGEKRLADFADRIIYWDVPNEPGTLRAVALQDGQSVAEHELKTAGKPARLQLLPDRRSLQPSGQDLAHVEVRVVDEAGVPVPGLTSRVQFTVSGSGKLAGVDNGDLDSAEDFHGAAREFRDSRCLAIVQSGRAAGKIRLVAKVDGLPVVGVEFEVGETRGTRGLEAPGQARAGAARG